MSRESIERRAERLFVVKLRQAGFSHGIIFHLTGHRTQYQNQWVERYKETGDVYDEPRSGRPVTVLTPEMKATLERMIRDRGAASPRRVQKELARQKKRISRTHIRRFIKSQPWGKPYKRKCHVALTAHQQRARLAWAKRNKKKSLAYWKRVIFSDEKRFHLNPRLNHQNDRVYTSDPELIPAREVKQGDSNWMVWAAVSYTGKSKLHIIPQQQTVTGAYYRDQIIRKVLIPGLTKRGQLAATPQGTARLVFQQDLATAHTARATERLLREELPCAFLDKESWAAKLVDINVMEKVWAIMDTKMLNKRFKTMGQLRAVIRRVWNEVSQQSIRKLYKSIPQRVKSIISCKGRIPPESKYKKY